MDYQASASDRNSSGDRNSSDRSRRRWTIPAQAAQWLDAGAESIESGSLQPAVDRARNVAGYLHSVRRRLVTGLVIASSLFFAWHVFYAPNGMVVYQHKRAEVKKLEAQITAMQTENDAYARRVDALTNDPHAIEQEARIQFHKVRPHEIVYVSPGAVPPAPPSNVTASNR